MRTKLIFLALLSALVSTQIFGQWMQTNGPYGGDISDLAVLADGEGGTYLFAGSLGGGVFRSSDNGTTWVTANNGLTSTTVSALVVIGTDLYAGTWKGRVSRSTDKGATWNAASSGMTCTSVYSLAVGPPGLNGKDLYAGTDDGFYYSTNNGGSWTNASTGLQKPVGGPLAVSETTIFAGTGDALFRSTNSGTTWTDVSSAFWKWGPTAVAVSGMDIFAGTAEGVFHSADNGTTWMKKSNGLTTTSVQTLEFSGTGLLAGTFLGGVFLSTDNGSSWTPASHGLTNLSIRCLGASGSNLFAGTLNGIFRSSNNGTNWSEASYGVTASFVPSIVLNGKNLFAASYFGGVFRSTDSGTTWTQVAVPAPFTFFVSVAVSGTKLYAGSYDGVVLLSTDNGTSWVNAGTGLPNVGLRNLAASGADVFAAVNGGLYRSTNNGTNWSDISSDLENVDVWSVFISGSNIFVGTWGNGVFRSTNNGMNWNTVNSGLKTDNMFDCFVFSGNALYVSGGNDGVYRSTNGGMTWTNGISGLENINVSSLAASGATLFAGSDQGVFCSANNGVKWTSASSGLQSTDIRCLAILDTEIFAGTYAQSIWRRPLSEMLGPPVTNLIQNPGFESGRPPWEFYTNGTGGFSDDAAGDGSPHAARLDISNGGTNVQLYQPGLTLKEGARYRLSFKAYSNGGHDLRVYIHKHGAPYTNYGIEEWGCDLTGGWKSFILEFKARNISGTVNDARLRFWLAPYATAGDRYFVDDVVLEEVVSESVTLSDVVINGSFEADGEPWEFYTNGTGSFDTDVPGEGSAHAGHVKVETSGTNVQLYQPRLELQAGAQYTLRFKAYSTSSHDMSVHVHKHGAPYTNYGLENWVVPVGTSWATYTVGFQAKNFAGTVNDARIRFWLAPFAIAGDEYFFDDVSLTKESASTGPQMETVTAVEQPYLPQETALSQNYPNPFNPTTVIEYTIRGNVGDGTGGTGVKLEVYDILGQEVATLVNATQSPGVYRVTWDATGRAAGVYLCRLHVGDVVQTKKLTLLK